LNLHGSEAVYVALAAEPDAALVTLDREMIELGAPADTSANSTIRLRTYK
jgi:predicted nucleic acid-binding protein